MFRETKDTQNILCTTVVVECEGSGPISKGIRPLSCGRNYKILQHQMLSGYIKCSRSGRGALGKTKDGNIFKNLATETNDQVLENFATELAVEKTLHKF